MSSKAKCWKTKVHQTNRFGPETSPLRRTDSEVLVLGIDFGTTGVKIAYVPVIERVDDDGSRYVVHHDYRFATLSGWPGERLHNLSAVPTHLVYNTNGQLLEWGNDAVNFTEKSAFNPEHQHQLVTNWKMGLHDSGFSESLKETAEKLGKRPESFIEDFCRALAAYLLECEESNLREAFRNSDFSNLGFAYIDIVLALPPGWKQHEHGSIRRAATKGFSKLPNLSLTTVSETESALRGWMAQSGRRIVKNGDVVMLVDLGGLTGCISAFAYEVCVERGGRWTHIESHSLLAGSELAGEEFEHVYKSRRKEAELPSSKKLLFKARRAFEMYKMAIGEANEEEEWICPSPYCEQDEVRRFVPDGMIFSKKELRALFEPFQDMILAKMEDVTSRLVEEDKKPKYCVFAGAYARNRLFKTKLRQLNTKMGMEPIWPQNLSELVATGACQARVEGDFRQLCGSRYSVGTLILVNWDEVPEQHREHVFKFQYPGDTNWWVRGIAWVMKRGDQIIPGHVIGPDKTHMRKRYPQGKMQFEETFYITEGHPGDCEHTFLKYSTVDTASCNRNYTYLRETHNLDINPMSYRLDLTMLKKPDGKPALRKMASKHLKRDKTGRYFDYGYYFETTQTDCRVSMQVILAKYKCRRIELQVSIEDIQDIVAESSELREEYNQQKTDERATVAIASRLESNVNNEIGMSPLVAQNPTARGLKRPASSNIPSGKRRRRQEDTDKWEVPTSPSKESGIDESIERETRDPSESPHCRANEYAAESLQPLVNDLHNHRHSSSSTSRKQRRGSHVYDFDDRPYKPSVSPSVHAQRSRHQPARASSASKRSAMTIRQLLHIPVVAPVTMHASQDDEEQEEESNIRFFQDVLRPSKASTPTPVQKTNDNGTPYMSATERLPSEPSPEEIRRSWSYEQARRGRVVNRSLDGDAPSI